MIKSKKDTGTSAAIDQLKYYLTLQLEAYLKKDWESYQKLERHILEVERDL